MIKKFRIMTQEKFIQYDIQKTKLALMLKKFVKLSKKKEKPCELVCTFYSTEYKYIKIFQKYQNIEPGFVTAYLPPRARIVYALPTQKIMATNISYFFFCKFYNKSKFWRLDSNLRIPTITYLIIFVLTLYQPSCAPVIQKQSELWVPKCLSHCI